MNHYCTYFDRGFLIQGLALWRSLAARDPDSVFWVLALDDFTAEVLRETGGTWMRVVTLQEIEHGDSKLAAAKANRTRIEYYFTLSPCWPRWLLANRPEIGRVTYVDADMYFFASPDPVFAAMDDANASVLITEHRFPEWLRHYERHGHFNVGILSFRNDETGRACLDDWRNRCLDWCFDRLEDGKYADQKYLDDWPVRVGPALMVFSHPGVNLAPWNWIQYRFTAVAASNKSSEAKAAREELRIDGHPLVLFHFARFRPKRGDWLWQSGQLEYGIMPLWLRRKIYEPYVAALLAARREIAERRTGFDFSRRPARLGREFWQALPLRLIFGGDWLRIGGRFFNLRCGLGRWSGRLLAALRRVSR